MIGETQLILQDIIENSEFEYCVVITSASAYTHTHAQYGGPREGGDVTAFHHLEDQILEWMGNMVIYTNYF